ncbi:MAG: polysaccharide biosynthesis C-terminal domain-containing protein, partial [Lachnospiraceae bacterium]|nr:polysaccharide biosynthesis C-terminal domain-containing protein [Lachnospiraceae bacterium]
MFLHLVVKTPYFFWMGKERYDYNYRIVVAGTVILSVGTPVIALLSLSFFQDKSIAVIGSKILIEVFLGIPVFVLILKKGKKLFSRVYWVYGLRNNIPLVPYYLSQIILNHSDRLMINSMCGSGEAGIYSVSYSAAMLLTMLNHAINHSIVPWKYRKLKKDDTEGIHQVTFSLMLFVMGLNAVLIALAPEAMTILAAKAYHNAIWIVPPVACSACLLFISQQFINIEFYFEENHYTALSSIGTAALNVVLNRIFIERYGYIAAGYTTLFCYLIFTVLHYITMRMVCKKHMNGKKIWKADRIFVSVVALILFSGLMLLCYNGYVVRYLIVAVLAVIGLIKKDSIKKYLKGSKDN